MLIKPANETTIDVFTGTGWNNWSRFEVKKFNGKPHLTLVKGQPMSKADFSTLFKEIANHG